jgi:hypothetical protein
MARKAKNSGTILEQPTATGPLSKTDAVRQELAEGVTDGPENFRPDALRALICRGMSNHSLESR